MSDYTAKDFKNAKFAEDEKGVVTATRDDIGVWYLTNGRGKTDGAMAHHGWRPVHEAAPLTLNTLREAWESTSVPSVVHVGDTIIQRDHLGESFSVFEAERDYPRPPLDIRILHRSPQPEPWQALADVLDDSPPWVEAWSAGESARWLHERGVRVTGGDES